MSKPRISRFSRVDGVAFCDDDGSAYSITRDKSDSRSRRPGKRSAYLNDPKIAYVCRLLCVIASRGIWKRWKAGEDIDAILYGDRCPEE